MPDVTTAVEICPPQIDTMFEASLSAVTPEIIQALRLGVSILLRCHRFLVYYLTLWYYLPPHKSIAFFHGSRLADGINIATDIARRSYLKLNMFFSKSHHHSIPSYTNI